MWKKPCILPKKYDIYCQNILIYFILHVHSPGYARYYVDLRKIHVGVTTPGCSMNMSYIYIPAICRITILQPLLNFPSHMSKYRSTKEWTSRRNTRFPFFVLTVVSVILKPLIRFVHAIYHWIDKEIAQLFYSEMISKFIMV